MADSEEGRTDELDHAAMAGLAGIVAATAPSRRAARFDILRAVTTE